MKPLSILVACACTSVVGVALLFVPSSPSSVAILFGVTLLLAGLIGYLFAEWRLLYAYSRISSVNLSTVEFHYNRLPYRSEIIATPLLSVIVAALFFQYVSIVYAMSFSVSSSTSETSNTVDVVLADFDGDGDLDYIAGNSDGGAPSQNFDVYRNSGSATFTHVGTINGASTSFSKFAAGDIDGDGDVDLVAGQAGAMYYLRTFVNNGSMTFTAGDSHSYAMSAAAVQDVLLVDVDNDGDLDIVPALSSTLSSSVILLNNGHGTFAESNAAMPAAQHIIAADFNSDGFIDLAVHAGGATSVQFLQNSGTGSFTQVDDVTGLGGVAKTLVVADADGDGDIDVLAPDSATPSYVHLLINDGTGNFSENSAPSVFDYGVTDLATADFDNDGDIDFLDVASDNSVPGNGNELWLNEGSLTFSNGWQNVVGSDATSSSLAVGDLDLDGDLDYVLGRSGTTANDVLIGAGAANAAPSAMSLSTLTGAVTNTHLLNQALAPTSAADDASIGTPVWSIPSSALVSDNIKSIVNLGVGDFSHYLTASNIGYSMLPANARITGIQVDVEKCNCGSVIAQDHAVRLIKGGVIGTTDRSIAGYWPAADATVTYGGPNDLWGTTWTANDVVSGSFGFAIAAKSVGGSGTAAIDSITVTIYYTSGVADFRLQWGSGSDVETPAKLLQYKVRMGTGSQTSNIISGVAASPHWVSRVVPNGQSRRLLVNNLSCGRTFYWSVATVDTGFKSTWSSEKSFTLTADCLLGSSGGGGGTSSSASGGGGGSVLFHQDAAKQEESSGGSQGILNVSLFRDTDQDGKKDGTENPLHLASLPVIITGRSLGGVRVERTERLDEQGRLSVTIEESDPLGYTVAIGSGADLHGNAATSKLTYDHVVVRNGTPSEIAVGFRPIELLAYRPCLTVTSAGGSAKDETDAEKLFSLLVDAYGRSISSDVTTKGTLMLRGDFLLALERTQCFPLAETSDAAEKQLRESPLHLHAFADLPVLPYTEKTRAAYSALVAGLPVTRSSGKFMVADLGSPVSRSEAIALIKAVFDSQKFAMTTASGGILPADVAADDPVSEPYLSLLSLHVLPESFLEHLGPAQGLTKNEASLLLVRAAYASGKIGLRDVSDSAVAAAADLNFMDLLPPLKPRSCLESVSARSTDISFSDVSPGTALFTHISALLPFGTRNTDGSMLWLIPGTRRLSEFGVAKGQQEFGPSAPSSVAETVRALLILSCMPPATAKQVQALRAPQDLAASAIPISGTPSTRVAGTAESTVPRDRISDLPRNDSLPSRILYRSQDHRREFDLSLFTFAEPLLLAETRSTTDSFSVSEASELFASALLGLEVLQGSLTPEQARGQAQDLSNAILQRLLGKDIDWRNESLGRNNPLTKAQLILFLHDVLGPGATSTSEPTQGQAWYERIRARLN